MRMHLLQYNQLVTVAIPTFDFLPDSMKVVTTVDSPFGVNMYDLCGDQEENADFVNTIYDLFDCADEYVEGDCKVIKDSGLTAYFSDKIWWVSPSISVEQRTRTERSDSWTTIKFLSLHDLDDITYAGSVITGQRSVNNNNVKVRHVSEVEDSLRLQDVNRAKLMLSCLDPSIFAEYSAVLIRASTATTTELVDIRPGVSTDLNYKEL